MGNMNIWSLYNYLVFTETQLHALLGPKKAEKLLSCTNQTKQLSNMSLNPRKIVVNYQLRQNKQKR